jgi:hypothetical protein
MKTETRLQEYQDKIMKDSKGIPYEGERVINYKDTTSPFGFSEIIISFKHGKIHNTEKEAVYYVDGHKEWWENGRFLSAVPAYALQEKTPLD